MGSAGAPGSPQRGAVPSGRQLLELQPLQVMDALYGCLFPTKENSSPTGPEMWRASLSHVHTHTHTLLIRLKCPSMRGDVVEGHSDSQRRARPVPFPVVTEAEIWVQMEPASISLMARVQDLERSRFLSPVHTNLLYLKNKILLRIITNKKHETSVTSHHSLFYDLS